MKLFNLSYALLLFATVSLVSCKDDDEPKNDNKFSFGSATHTISNGFFLKDETPGHDDNENVYYRNSLLFLSDGLTVTSDNDMLGVTGQGHLIELLINNAGQELQTGTYTWQSEENEQPFDLWVGYVVLDYNTDNEMEYELQSGTVTVAKSGEKYKITFEGVALLEDEEGDAVPDTEMSLSGQFEGQLTVQSRDF